MSEVHTKYQSMKVREAELLMLGYMPFTSQTTKLMISGYVKALILKLCA